LGAALGVWHKILGNQRTVKRGYDSMAGSYLGPDYTNDEIRTYLLNESITFEEVQNGQLASRVADLIAHEKVLGWFQGRVEFGPRALGARSILGDPRSAKMQEKMNLKIKFRESFRPFAPSVLREKVGDWFEIEHDSPYMLFVAQVKKDKQRQISCEEDSLFGIDKLKVVRSKIPAVTHVDYSARIQTIQRDTHPIYYELVECIYERTGCPVVINTSFNVRGEPPVCSPADAYKCFMRTDMDYLIMNNFIIDKSNQQPLAGDSNWQQEFVLD
jgi:carbamoyltransferase